MSAMRPVSLIPACQAANCGPARRDPKAIGALAAMSSRVRASETAATQAAGNSTRNGSGTGSPRSPARHAAIASRVRLITPWSHRAESLAKTSTSAPFASVQTSMTGRVRPFRAGRTNSIAVARLSKRRRRSWLEHWRCFRPRGLVRITPARFVSGVKEPGRGRLTATCTRYDPAIRPVVAGVRSGMIPSHPA